MDQMLSCRDFGEVYQVTWPWVSRRSPRQKCTQSSLQNGKLFRPVPRSDDLHLKGSRPPLAEVNQVNTPQHSVKRTHDAHYCRDMLAAHITMTENELSILVPAATNSPFRNKENKDFAATISWTQPLTSSETPLTSAIDDAWFNWIQEPCPTPTDASDSDDWAGSQFNEGAVGPSLGTTNAFESDSRATSTTDDPVEDKARKRSLSCISESFEEFLGPDFPSMLNEFDDDWKDLREDDYSIPFTSPRSVNEGKLIAAEREWTFD